MKPAALPFVLALCLAGRTAFATIVVVDGFTGPKNKEVRAAVVEALGRAYNDVIKPPGARVPPSSDESVYVAHAGQYHAAAFVDGDVKQQKGGLTVVLTVHNGADGKVLGTTTLKGAKLPKLLKNIDDSVVQELEPSLEQASAPGAKKAEPEKTDAPEKAEAPAAEESKKAPEEPAPEADEEPREKHRAPPPEEHGRKAVPLELSGGLQGFSRSFEYHQDVNSALHPYHLPFWPALEARAGYYPGAHFTNDMAANIGIVVGFSRSVGASSELGSSGNFGTTMQEITAGARFRLPIARHELGVSVLYGNHQFAIESDHDPARAGTNGLAVNRTYVPDATYQYVRPGLDARLVFGKFRFGAGLGYRAVLGMGELTSDKWFPHATAQALDGYINAGYELLSGFYVVGGFDAARYALDMHTSLADRAAAREVAGGAVDQYLTGHLGVEFRLGEASASDWRVSQRTRQSGTW